MSTAKTYSDHVDDLATWMDSIPATQANTSVSATGGQAQGGQPTPATPTKRTWCTLGLTDLTPPAIIAYFDRSAPNKKFSDEYKLKRITNNPVAFLQTENDMIYALQKAFMFRHQPRLASYRDDCEQKGIRVWNMLHKSRAMYQHLQDIV